MRLRTKVVIVAIIPSLLVLALIWLSAVIYVDSSKSYQLTLSRDLVHSNFILSLKSFIHERESASLFVFERIKMIISDTNKSSNINLDTKLRLISSLHEFQENRKGLRSVSVFRCDSSRLVKIKDGILEIDQNDTIEIVKLVDSLCKGKHSDSGLVAGKRDTSYDMTFIHYMRSDIRTIDQDNVKTILLFEYDELILNQLLHRWKQSFRRDNPLTNDYKWDIVIKDPKGLVIKDPLLSYESEILFDKERCDFVESKIPGTFKVETWISREEVEKSTFIIQASFTAIFAFLILGYVFLLRAIRAKFVKPLELLKHAFEKTSKGSFGDKLIWHSNDEISDLVNGYNNLNSELSLMRDHIKQKSRDSAIAKTILMLAHDVRKPFSMLEGILATFRNISNIKQLKEAAEESIPEVKRAIKNVNGLLQDILEIDSKTNLQVATITVESLIEMVVIDSLRYQVDAEILLSYKFNHKTMIEVDQNRIIRVFSNIFTNALQAMDYKGLIWFRTKNITKNGFDYIQVAIGNNNSYIKKEDISQLFEAFFSKGKKNGTGLGLAISKKIVNNHGGEIWCRSSLEKGTEFIFTIPASNPLVKKDYYLPCSSKEIVKYYSNDTFNFDDYDISTEIEEISKEGKLTKIFQSFNSNIKILIVDDEKVYRNSLKDLIYSLTDLNPYLEFLEAQNSDDAINICITKKPELIIMDIDLNETKMDGFNTVKILREGGNRGVICIHSNRGFKEYNQKALEVGADTFLPKPISKIHLLKLIEDSIKERSIGFEDKLDKSNIKGKIIVLDDTSIFLNCWKQQKMVDTILFKSPEDFWDAYMTKKFCIGDIHSIITDYYFDNSSSDGISFATQCRDRKIKVPIFLSSEKVFDKDILNKFGIDDQIPKSPEKSLRIIERSFYQNKKANRIVYSPTINQKSSIGNRSLAKLDSGRKKANSSAKNSDRKHEFNRLLYTLRSLREHFDLRTFENKRDRLDISCDLNKFLKIINFERNTIKGDSKELMLRGILCQTEKIIHKVKNLLTDSYPFSKEIELSIKNELNHARSRLIVYQQNISEIRD